MGFVALILSYLLGGLTFLPLIAAAVFLHGYVYLPPVPASTDHVNVIIHETERDRALEEKLSTQAEGHDSTSGYFAVCREWVPGGVNGKPPERTTPAGETVTADSPSVYQSMYRSIFERGKAQQASLDGAKIPRKSRNVFFVTIRHSHLLLFDDSQEVDIRHVISLTHYNVDVYAGAEPIPEGELWIKRNCIRLRKKSTLVDAESHSAPFFLFSENCSQKEDFYHALLRNQKQDSEHERALPAPLAFETDDMIKLIRQLHVSEENTQTRWLNALLGRLFLSMYKTREVEDHIRNKITKKISRVAKPAFITSIALQDVDLGDCGPSFMNPKLREMTVDGALTIEADVRYSGNFKAVIAAVARIDLGSKLKAREVNMVLAGILKRLEGHMLLKMKPPPSNRLWFSFETMPKLDISLEPVVSSRRITYDVVLRALVGRIREVVKETLVYPNWDDIPFFNTEGKGIRGGVWKSSDGPESFTDAEKKMESSEQQPGEIVSPDSDQVDLVSESRITDSTVEMPGPSFASAVDSPSHSPAPTLDRTGLEKQGGLASASSPAIVTAIGADKPKAMRSNSFASAASPMVSKSPATTEGTRRRSNKGRKDAASTMKDLASRSPELSPVHSPSRSMSNNIYQENAEILNEEQDSFDDIPHATSRNDGHNQDSNVQNPVTSSALRLRAASMTDPMPSSSPRSATTTERTRAFNQSLTSATAAATKWSLGVLNMHERSNSKSAEKPPRSEPMGRGQPLPPPGMPLPKPERNTWSSSAFNTLRRKPVGSISQGSDSSSKQTSAKASPSLQADSSVETHRPSPPSLRLDPAPETLPSTHPSSDNLMTILVPKDSNPSTPRPQTPEPEYAKELNDGALSSPMTGS